MNFFNSQKILRFFGYSNTKKTIFWQPFFGEILREKFDFFNEKATPARLREVKKEQTVLEE